MENKKKNVINAKDITLIALMTTILFTLEQLLTFLPNIQLTVFLLVLYSKKLGLIKTAIISIIHVFLDCLVMGGFNMLFAPFMLVGWLVIPITLNTIFKKVESNIVLAFLGVLFAFIYSWIYIIPNCIILHIDFIAYLVSDIIFEVLLATSSFLSIMLLYNPCAKIFDRYKINKEIS